MNELIKLNEKQMRGKSPSITLTKNTWVAGGAIRQWFVGNEKKSDIDIFGVNDDALNGFVLANCQGAKLIFSSINAHTYDRNGDIIQIIRGKHFTSLEQALQSFDFNVCQFGWDGNFIYSTTEAVISVLRGHLGVNSISKELAADSLRRAFKYQKKGYIPCHGTILEICKSFVGLSDEQIESQVALSPSGGKRILGID